MAEHQPSIHAVSPRWLSRRTLTGRLAGGAVAWTVAFATASTRAAQPATPLTAASPASGATPQGGTARAVNIVLVHGAWADGSSWSGVIPRLASAGYNVSAVQAPLTSLAEDVAAVRRVLAMQTGPTILAGHSYGGLVITQAAVGLTDVRGLVYVSAFAPDKGESMQDLASQGQPSPGVAAIRPDKSGYLWIERGLFPKVFAADVAANEAAVLAIVQKPLNGAILTTKLTDAAWHSLPSWFLVSEHDQMIPPPAQQLMAQRMHAQVTSIPSSHASLISHAQETADLIAGAASSIGG